MSHCRYHRDAGPDIDFCSGCWNDASILLEAFRKVGFRGKIDVLPHHQHNALRAIEMLRKASHWGAADLLEAAVSAWNTMDWKREGGT